MFAENAFERINQFVGSWGLSRGIRNKAGGGGAEHNAG
jgi:hypothetical protein